MPATEQVVIIDARPQCCTLNLVHYVSQVMKKRNAETKILAVTTDTPVQTKHIDKLLKTDGKFTTHLNLIFLEIMNWLS